MKLYIVHFCIGHVKFLSRNLGTTIQLLFKNGISEFNIKIQYQKINIKDKNIN